jgi:hypothetical protein
VPIPREHRVLTLLSEEPAGRISTRNAGAVSFEASLSWRPDDGIPAELTLCEPASGARFYFLVQTEDLASVTRQVSCEIRALYAEQLTGALDGALRSVTTHATLTGAVLETHAVRLANPIVSSKALVEELAWQLWRAGFPVSFGPSWTPAPGVDVSVGIQGLEDAFEAFLQAHPTWHTLSSDRLAPRPALALREAETVGEVSS